MAVPGLVQQLGERESHSRDPCPAADGTVFDSMVDFKVACGVDMPKSDLAQLNANNFTHCMDICISWHPKCLGFAFDALGESDNNAHNCWPKSFLAPAVTQKYIMDSAVATNVPAADDDLKCGKYYAPGSLGEVQASSMANCIDQCAQYNKDHSPKCVAVAYESSQNYGYLNCQFKQSVDTSGMAPNPNYKFDMALAVANPTSSTAVPSSPTSTISPAKTADPAGPIVSSTGSIAASSTIPQSPDTSSAGDHGNGQGTSGSYVPSWVVGAIVGPVLALVLVGLILLYSWQKRRAVRADQPKPSFKLLSITSTASSRNNVVAPSPVPVSRGELEAQVRPGELEAYTPPTLVHGSDNSSRWKVSRF
ncbi:hypothetical protein PG994_007890 [Apiospora phragmitis]|uniref:Apple domain-containing protein n=1 Tax=Apiospora phragmitis TaxID=2905665 RepID=A0ABR1URI1_9PEZI